MGTRSLFLTVFFMWAALVGGCAQLTSDYPLFSVADQVGPPPITEGIWLMVGDDECPERNAPRRSNFDRKCVPLEIRRLDDGTWQARWRLDLAPRLPASDRDAVATRGPLRFVVVSAMRRQTPDAYAPLYFAEVYPSVSEERVGYYLLAPIGQLPATTLLVGPVFCDAALRDGPIDGIVVTYGQAATTTEESAASDPNDPGLKQLRSQTQQTPAREIESCTAGTQEAVREATRRAFIEAGASEDGPRLTYIRPLER